MKAAFCFGVGDQPRQSHGNGCAVTGGGRIPRCGAHPAPACPSREKQRESSPVSLNIAKLLGTEAATVPLIWPGKPSMEVVMENWSNAKYCDVANLILGAILFF